MAASEHAGIPKVLTCHSVAHHPLEELLQGVFAIGRGGIGVVSLLLRIPNQHRFAGVVTANPPEFSGVLKTWEQLR